MKPATAAVEAAYLKLFQRVASNPANFRGTSAHGVSTYTKTYSNGRQAWVEVHNGRINNAGINLPGAHR